MLVGGVLLLVGAVVTWKLAQPPRQFETFAPVWERASIDGRFSGWAADGESFYVLGPKARLNSGGTRGLFEYETATGELLTSRVIPHNELARGVTHQFSHAVAVELPDGRLAIGLDGWLLLAQPKDHLLTDPEWVSLQTVTYPAAGAAKLPPLPNGPDAAGRWAFARVASLRYYPAAAAEPFVDGEAGNENGRDGGRLVAVVQRGSGRTPMVGFTSVLDVRSSPPRRVDHPHPLASEVMWLESLQPAVQLIKPTAPAAAAPTVSPVLVRQTIDGASTPAAKVGPQFVPWTEGEWVGMHAVRDAAGRFTNRLMHRSAAGRLTPIGTQTFPGQLWGVARLPHTGTTIAGHAAGGRYVGWFPTIAGNSLGTERYYLADLRGGLAAVREVSESREGTADATSELLKRALGIGTAPVRFDMHLSPNGRWLLEHCFASDEAGQPLSSYRLLDLDAILARE